LGGKGGAINYQKKRIKIVNISPISPIDKYPEYRINPYLSYKPE
jgi:hypothetical protein